MPVHPTQTHPRPHRAARPYKGLPMEGLIARWYTANRRIDPDIAPLMHQLRQFLPTGNRVLEVAPGPGYLAIELARAGFVVTGLDISHSFVRIAGEQAARAGVSIDFRHGNASAMPFTDRSFDFIICRAAFKNFSEPVEAVREMHRVLRPGGTALIQDLRGDTSRADIRAYVATLGLDPINGFMTRMALGSFLLKNAYTPASMRAIVVQTAFGDCRIEQEHIGMSVWLERPTA